MPVSGRLLTIEEALALCYAVGFRQLNLITAVALMKAESGRFVEAYNINTNGSMDRGIFQINTIHAPLGIAEAFRAVPNARFAFSLSGGNDFTPWAAFNNGAHEQFMQEVRRVRDDGGWRGLVPIIFEELGEEMPFGVDFKAGWGAHRAGMVKSPEWPADKRFGWDAREEAVENPPVYLIEHEHQGKPDHRHAHVHGEDVPVET